MNRIAASMFRISVAVIALSQPAISLASSTAAESPQEVVRALNHELVAALRRDDLRGADKGSEIRDIVHRRADFSTMSRMVLARNWSVLTEAQKIEFREQFERQLSLTYGKSIAAAHDGTVKIRAERRDSRGDLTLQTEVVRWAGGPKFVDYRLRMIDGQWKVIDLIIERRSLLASFRDRFEHLIASGGVDRLLAVLREPA